MARHQPNPQFAVRATQCSHDRFECLYRELIERHPNMTKRDAFGIVMRYAEQARREGKLQMEETEAA